VAFLTPQRFTDKLVMRKPAQLANLIELRTDLRRKARIAGIATISARFFSLLPGGHAGGSYV
jgi:hypothetical protein